MRDTLGFIKIIFLAAPFFFSKYAGTAQTVFTTEYRNQANAILYETKYKSEADIIIYKTDYRSKSNPELGFWYDEKYVSRAEWKVYWTKYPAEADCRVFFVKYQSEARKNTCYLESRAR